MNNQAQAMIIIGDKSYRCDCGCNVFTKTGEYRYRCNACQATYHGEPKHKILSLDERIEAWRKNLETHDVDEGTIILEADGIIFDLKAERDTLVEFKKRVYDAYTPNSHYDPIKLEALLIAHMVWRL